MFRHQGFLRNLLLLLVFNSSILATSIAQSNKFYVVNTDSVASYSALESYKENLIDSIFQDYSLQLKKSVDSLIHKYKTFIRHSGDMTLKQQREGEIHLKNWNDRLKTTKEKIEKIPSVTDTVYYNYIKRLIVETYLDHYGNNHFLLDRNAGIHYTENSSLTNWFIQEIDKDSHLKSAPPKYQGHYFSQLKLLLELEVEDFMNCYSSVPDIYELTTSPPK